MFVRSVFARFLEVEVPESSLRAWTNRHAGLPAKTAIIDTVSGWRKRGGQ